MKPFNDEAFKKFRDMINERLGIFIAPSKKEILNTKLNKLMLRNKITTYDEYFNLLSRDRTGRLMTEFTDAITVNKTSFFREAMHFDFIRNNIRQMIVNGDRSWKNRQIRVWSSACSSGEEPYTLAMVLQECLPEGIEAKILATDINTQVLARAQKAVYPPSALEDMEKGYARKYFRKTEQGFEVSQEIRQKVTFRLFNLMDPFPFQHHFDIIFCRNVMIYFDAKAKKSLLEKFHQFMEPGSFLFIGHSESITDQSRLFRYVHPTVYTRT